ncbi:PLATZ transcription factor family protein [Rhynchospora pubera]|uniref:PLATZ transcription factor family protein n=1 Tax=Rhynchospora pubera TaxID=906938 RepID=A0AAV8DMZ2_9POAL|nr:PLATZ transcription factor family protein [Rhynchospora pubera]KAJ4820300.1 PLATZ transcription factor family protein [Rhynchospora pubera]
MEPDKASLPNWLQPLLAAKFFERCERHINERKNEINHFCMKCTHPLCPRCVIEHTRKGGIHRLLQIRHYVHSDVVRVNDITKLLDIAKIQDNDNNDNESVFDTEESEADCDYCYKLEVGVKRSFTEKEESSSGSEKGNVNCSRITSYRKKGRKGIPVRSPFF